MVNSLPGAGGSNLFLYGYGPRSVTAPPQNVGAAFVQSLNPDQANLFQQKNTAFNAFETELTPEQKAAQQKWRLEQAEGLPPAQWQADRQAFVSTLTPQQAADRDKMLALQKAFVNTLSPEQRSERDQLIKKEQAGLVQRVGAAARAGAAQGDEPLTEDQFLAMLSQDGQPLAPDQLEQAQALFQEMDPNNTGIVHSAQLQKYQSQIDDLQQSASQDTSAGSSNIPPAAPGTLPAATAMPPGSRLSLMM